MIRYSLSLLALAVIAFACPRADAQVKPFKIAGVGCAPQGLSLIPLDARPHTSIGNATHLGKHTSSGTFQILNFTSATTADFSSGSPHVFVAANGDKLAFTYGDMGNNAKQPGKVTLSVVGGTPTNPVFVAKFVAEFNPVPSASTGRFKDVVAGSFIMVAQSSPFTIVGTNSTPFAYAWEGDGWLQFKK